jgi:protein transport protein SEC23
VAPAAGPAFLFVVDKCIPAQDLGALKKSISHTIGLLPGNAVIGLVSFAAQVHVHDFGSMKHYTKALVFDCDRECTTARVCCIALAFFLLLAFL